MLTPLSDWIGQHTWLLGMLAAGSATLLVASVLATPWFVAQLPEDYLLRPESESLQHPVLNLVITTLRTFIGGTLILLGLLMLFFPGPGIVTLLVGLSVAQFPGKQHLLRFLASRESVFNSLNWMRRRHGKGPMLHPHHKDVSPEDQLSR